MYITLSPKTTAKGIYYVYTKLTLIPFLANLDERFPFFFFIPLKSEHIDNLFWVVFQIVNHDIILNTMLRKFNIKMILKSYQIFLRIIR